MGRRYLTRRPSRGERAAMPLTTEPAPEGPAAASSAGAPSAAQPPLRRCVLAYMRAAVTSLACVGTALALAAPAVADECTSDVGIGVAPGTSLTSAVRVRVSNNCKERTYDVTFTAYLKVGERRIARLPAQTMDAVPAEGRRLTLAVPTRYIDAARAEGRRAGRRRATLKFVVRVRDHGTGEALLPFASDSFLLLRR
jgi:hypothetical protein